MLSVDGRVARGQRSRGAVAEALMELLREGDARPTAARVAERAGVSLRLVHHHFKDREALFVAAMDRQREHLQPYVQPVPMDRPFSERLGTFVKNRALLLEVMGPVRRAGLAEEPHSPVVHASLSTIRAIKRNQVRQVFEPELAARSGAVRADLLAAACTAASWSAWEELRSYQGLSVTRARRVMKRALSTLFAHFE